MDARDDGGRGSILYVIASQVKWVLEGVSTFGMLFDILDGSA